MKRILKVGCVMISALLFAPTVFADNTYFKDIIGWEESFMAYPSGLELKEEWGVHLVRDAGIVPDGDAAISVSIAGGVANGHHANLAQTVAMEEGKTYRLSGKIFVPAKTWRYSIKFGEKVILAGDGALGAVIGEWTDLEYIFTYIPSEFGNSKQFRITANSPDGGAIYADNLSLKEILYEEDGETVSGYGDELFVNGDFETDLDWTAPQEVTNIQVQNMDSCVKLSWSNPLDTDLKEIMVFDITNGSQLLLKTDGEEALIENLENLKTYRLCIITSDGWNNRSEGVFVEICPKPDDTKWTEAEFLIDGEAVDAIAPGELVAKMQIKNNYMPEDYSVELILVLLKDGAIYDMDSAYKTIIPSEYDQPYAEISVGLTVPEGEGFTAQLYAWDSIAGMEALTKAYTLGE